MGKQLHLFELIKSLTKSEKRYFKLFNSTFEGKNNTNLKLFNAIDKQKKYNEKELKEKLSNESFVKHFAVAKSNLFNSILKSLRIYHENSDNSKKINQHKRNFKILFERGLLNIAKVQIDKGMKLAIKYEFLEDKILLARWHNTINAYFEFRNNKNKEVENIFIKPLEYIEELSDVSTYTYICHQIDFLVLQNTIRSKKTQQEINRILNLPELKEDRKNLPFTAKHKKYHILLSCYVGQKEYDKAFPVNQQIINLTINDPRYKKLEPYSLLNDYNNYLHTAVHVASLEKVKQLMKEYLGLINSLKNVCPSDLEERIFEAKYFYEVEYYILNNQFTSAIDLMPIIEYELKKIEDKISDYLYAHFNYNFAYLYFMCGDYLKSQQYKVKLINSARLKIRTDYIAGINLLKLFIHFELNHFDHLNCELKNVKELLKRKGYLYEFENQAIHMLKKLINQKQTSLKIKTYKEFKKVFELLAKQVENRDAFEKMNIYIG